MRCHYLSRMRDIERNLARVYSQRTRAEYLAGLDWYPSAHRIVCDWAHTLELPIACVACVIAALSPQCSWERNLIIADDVLHGLTPSVGGALPANVRKARRILEDRACAIADYMPYGYKVNTFAANLAGNYDVATVDTHGIQAALYDVQSTITLRRNSYDVFSQCYVNAATKEGMRPAHYQAVVWLVWKRLHPTRVKIGLRTQWQQIGEF